MIYCTSCKHHVRHGPGRIVWCKNPKNGIHLSDGSTKPTFAEHTRNNETRCGQDAKWWEAMPETKPTWWKMFWSKIR